MLGMAINTNIAIILKAQIGHRSSRGLAKIVRRISDTGPGLGIAAFNDLTPRQGRPQYYDQ